MRIALLAGSFLPMVGGLEWKVHYLAEEYLKHGHDVIVFAPWASASLRQPPMPVPTNYKIVRCTAPIPGFGRLGITKVLYVQTFMRYHKRRPFDILHCHSMSTPTDYGVAIKKRTGIPTVSTTTGGDIVYDRQLNLGERLDPTIERMVRHNAQTIEIIGSISSATRIGLEELNPTARIVDIPNGVAWNDFQTEPDTTLRQRLGLSETTTLLLSVGRYTIHKGYEYAIPAIAKLVERCPDVHYVILGRNLDCLRPLIQQHKMEKHITLLGQVPIYEVPPIMHACDIYFAASILEGFPQTNVQAMSCRLPCVTTDAPGNHDIAEHGGAFVARSADPTSMATQLAKLVEDPGLRETLAAKAFAASKRYAWSSIAIEYLELFEELLQSSSSTSQSERISRHIEDSS